MEIQKGINPLWISIIHLWISIIRWFICFWLSKDSSSNIIVTDVGGWWSGAYIFNTRASANIVMTQACEGTSRSPKVMLSTRCSFRCNNIFHSCVHCVATPFWRNHGIIITSYVRWVRGVSDEGSPLLNSSSVWYSISQEICTRFCCALLCCGYAIVHDEFTWSIYPYSSGLLCWHWGNR